MLVSCLYFVNCFLRYRNNIVERKWGRERLGNESNLSHSCFVKTC